MENYTQKVPVPSSHAALPDGANDAIHGARLNPVYRGELAKIYQFSLHAFQRIYIVCLEHKELDVVIAPASAKKSIIANYTIAMAIKDNKRVIYVSVRTGSSVTRTRSDRISNYKLVRNPKM
ncbi:putative RNA helicase [Helianthus anomalus]